MRMTSPKRSIPTCIVANPNNAMDVSSFDFDGSESYCSTNGSVDLSSIASLEIKERRRHAQRRQNNRSAAQRRQKRLAAAAATQELCPDRWGTLASTPPSSSFLPSLCLPSTAVCPLDTTPTSVVRHSCNCDEPSAKRRNQDHYCCPTCCHHGCVSTSGSSASRSSGSNGSGVITPSSGSPSCLRNEAPQRRRGSIISEAPPSLPMRQDSNLSLTAEAEDDDDEEV